RFLQEIKTWLEENPQDHKRVQIQSASTPGYRRVQAEISDEPSHMISYKAFQSGSSIKDIATRRELTEQTIENHLFKAFEQGHPLFWDIFISLEQEKAVLEAREKIEEQKLSLIKELLPEEFTYLVIKAVLVKNGLWA